MGAMTDRAPLFRFASRFGLVFGVLSAGSLSTGCLESSAIDGSGTNDVVEDTGDVDAYLMSLPKLSVEDAQPKTQISCDGLCPPPEQSGDFACTYTRYTETGQFDKFTAFQPNSATLWPGTVVRGADAQEGLLTPIGVELAPVTFSVSLENINASPVGKMDEPSLSAFREARNQILAAGVTGSTPASLDFEVVEVSSSSQVGFALGAGVEWPGGPDIAASFDFESSSRKTKILVNFTQAYYTIDVDTPAKPSQFFAEGTTVEDLEPWMNAESPPVYVQSITFGRRVIFSVQTERSASQLKAALEASYSAAVASGSVSISAEHQATLNESEIRAFVLGGSGEDATGAIQGFEGLVSYIRRGGSYSKDSPGAPIAYKLAYLDNAVTKLAFTTDYAERNCVKNRARLRFDLESIKHVSGSDPGGNVELYGQVVVRYPTAASPVKSCNEGGALAWLWNMPDGSWVSFPEYGTWTPSSAQYIEMQDVPVSADSRICIIADMWEEDGSTGELSGDDDFGVAGLSLAYSSGWGGTHHVVTTGSGNNSTDVAVRVTVE